MNILFISGQPYPYGMASSKRIRLFAEYLGINNQVQVMICASNNARNNNEGNLKNVSWEFKIFSKIDYLFNYKGIYALLKGKYILGESNIICLYDGISLKNIFFAIIGKKLGYYIFTDIVEDYRFSSEKGSVFRRLLLYADRLIERRGMNFVDGIIVISKKLLNKYNNNKYNKRIIHIPISSENYNMNFKRIENDKFTFLYSGTFGKKDGVSFLIDAFKKLSINYNYIKLILSGIISKPINLQIKDYDRIDYVGLIDDKNYYKFLSNANVLMMTRINSKYANSGFPFKLGEYLATANPVIATNVSDVSDYLIDKKNALIAKPSSVLSIYEKMEFCLNNKDKLNLIGINGKKVSLKYFNPDINGEKIEQFILDTINMNKH